ncbi:MAG: Co2+/Mg2+ efflux protein ApaG [Gammaproteobacteria bacterium]
MSNDPRYHIDVEVRSEYRADQSRVHEKRYVFAYHIRLHNRGSVAAKLLSRHWIITNGDQQAQEVRGDGVVGQTPRLAPGEHFEYSSGCVLATPVGAMHGSYRMLADDGTQFDAPIAPFTLAVPGVLN